MTGVAGKQWSERWATPLVAALTLLVVLLCFGPGIDTSLVSDGYSLVVNPGVRAEPLAAHFTRPYNYSDYYRPLTTLSLDLTNRLLGDAPTPHHLIQLLLHWLACLALYGLARRLLSSRLWGAAAALLFAVHPLVMHTTLWVGDRSDALALPLMLGALYAYLRWSESESEGWRRRSWLAVAALVQLAALLAKEAVLVAPALAGLLVWWRARTAERPFKRNLLIVLAVSLAVVVLYYGWRLVFGLGGDLPLTLRGLPQRLVYYLALLPGVAELKTVSRPLALLPALVAALVCLGPLVWGTVRSARRTARGRLAAALTSPPGLALLWIIINLAPVSFAFNLWYYYFIVPGFVLGLAWLLRELWRRRKIVGGIAFALLLGYYLVAGLSGALHWRRCAEAGDALTADLTAQRQTIIDSGSLTLMTVPWFFSREAVPLPTPVYNYAWGMPYRLEHELGSFVEFRCATYTVVGDLDDWGYDGRRTGDTLLQTSADGALARAHNNAYTPPGVDFTPGEVRLEASGGSPVFALVGDRFELLYAP